METKRFDGDISDFPKEVDLQDELINPDYKPPDLPAPSDQFNNGEILWRQKPKKTNRKA